MWQRHAELATTAMRRRLIRMEAGRVRKYEAGLLSRFDVVFAVSGRDRDALGALGATGPEIALLPNVADPALLERPELRAARRAGPAVPRDALVAAERRGPLPVPA